MGKIEKSLVKPLTELLGAERTEDLKDKIAQLILKKVEDELEASFDQVYMIDPDVLNDFGNEVLEEMKGTIKQKLEAKYMEIAEKAISKVRVED